MALGDDLLWEIKDAAEAAGETLPAFLLEAANDRSSDEHRLRDLFPDVPAVTLRLPISQKLHQALSNAADAVGLTMLAFVRQGLVRLAADVLARRKS